MGGYFLLIKWIEIAKFNFSLNSFIRILSEAVLFAASHGGGVIFLLYSREVAVETEKFCQILV